MSESPEHPNPDGSQPPGRAQLGPGAGARMLVVGALLGGGAAYGLVAIAGPNSVGPPGPRRASIVAPLPPRKPLPAAKPPVPELPKAPEGVNVAGSVVDEFGRAIAGATVFIGQNVPKPAVAREGMPLGELGVTSGPVPAIPTDVVTSPPEGAPSVPTDQDGKFLMAKVKPGTVQIFATAVGYEPNLTVLENVKPGDVPAPVHLVLYSRAEQAPGDPIATADDPSLGRISGLVIDRFGHPVPNADVRTDEGDSETRTSPKGEFVLTGITPGALELVADDATAGSATSREVRARPGETLSGVRIYLPGRHVASAADAEAPPLAIALVASKSVSRTLGGIVLQDRPNGTFVSQVETASPPGKAGLKRGDSLLRVDGEPVLSAAQARGMLRDPVGLPIKVQVMRGPKRVTLRWKRPGGWSLAEKPH